MLKAYKYRLYPTKQQEILLNKHFGACRMIYNLALETKKYAYSTYGVNLTAYDLIKQLTDLKKDHDWLYEVANPAFQQSILRLNNAYKNFFKQGVGFPKFKSKRHHQSFSLPEKTKVDFVAGKLMIMKFSEGIRCKFDRTFEGKIKTCTISKTPTGKYFVSILVDNGAGLPIKKPVEAKSSIGIDLGLKHFIVTDSGIKIDNPKYLRESLQRLQVLQKRASRKKKGSANRKKANLKVAKLNEKITNRRLDFIHKVTTGLINDNQVDTLIMEDLNVKGMISNHKLAQAISDVSWAKFKEILAYKCEWSGKNLITIGRWEPSSKKCSECGHVKPDLKLSDRTYECTNCGSVMDRDINAAINIKNFGLLKHQGCVAPDSGQELPVEPGELLAVAGAVNQEVDLRLAG